MNKRSLALTRRRFLHTSAAFAGAAPFLVTQAYASWPDRPVKLVVPFAPGGPVDVIARLLQPLLAEELKANFFIENKPGAAGSIGVGQVARAEPDGYTVLITSNTIMINPLLYKSVPYDLEKDFIPLVDMAGSPTAYTVNPKSGIKTVAEFVAFAKEKKGAVNYGSAGFATPSHLAGEFFKNRAGLEMTHVPFNGAGPANQALLGGQVDMVSSALPGAHPHIIAGTLTGLAVTGEKRWFDLPNVPTMVEAGYPGFVLDTYTLVLLPTQTPAEIVERLSSAVRTILQKPDVRDKLRAVGLEVTAGGPDELKARFARELPMWRDVVKIAGIPPQ
ncbi:MAG: tripartite tricarboxylate transporter substrate binding protein [Pseudolabrys sp.]|jgi:tripartite-type tricarboxylate transporter receptor subunit TctC